MDTISPIADQDLYFSIFHREDAVLNWSNHFRYAREQKLLSPELTRQWIAALKLFRKELGKDVPWKFKYDHPLTNMITNAGQPYVDRLIQYAEVLRYSRNNDPKYYILRQKLQSAVRAKEEAMYFLHLCDLFLSAGMQVGFVPEIKTQPTPDLVFTHPDTPDIIYGEVSRLEESQHLQKYHASYDQLRRTLEQNLRNPLYSAIQLQLAPLDYPATVAPRLAALAESVAKTNTSQEYNDDYLSIHLFPLSQQVALQTWLDENDRRKGFNGPPDIPLDETSSIANNKIADKSKQIPANNAGILFLPVSALHFWQQRVSKTIADIQPLMNDQPQVLGTYLFAESLHVDAQQFRFNEDDGFDRTPLAGALTRYSLFIPNPVFERPLNPATYKKLLAILSPRSYPATLHPNKIR
jgi:hypothetical protein